MFLLGSEDVLINFDVENFLSFKDNTNFSMETGNRIRKLNDEAVLNVKDKKILKSSIIFGANGAGKTNLIFALMRLKNLIFIANVPGNFQRKVLPYSPFAMGSDDKENTTFEIEIFKNDYYYKYYLSYNSERIVRESLDYKKKYTNEYTNYFLRESPNNNSDNFEFKITTLKRKDKDNTLKSIALKTRKNRTFLGVASEFNDDICSEVISWFREDLIFVDDKDAKDYFRYLEDSSFKKTFLSLLKYADFNIKDVDVVHEIVKYPIFDAEGKQIDVENYEKRELYLIYKKYDNEGNVIGSSRINFLNDSSGTGKMIQIALILLATQNQNKVLVMDEFDRSFHSFLAETILRIFNSKVNKNQLIATTHELYLLDSPLRIDQIWFIEKDFTGESNLFSIFDFNLDSKSKRGDISFFKRYIKGQFGGTPIVDYESMISILEEKEEQINE